MAIGTPACFFVDWMEASLDMLPGDIKLRIVRSLVKQWV
jgi:hypothetical protein